MNKIFAILLGFVIAAFVGVSFLKGNVGHDLAQVAYAAQPKAPELKGTKADWLNTPGDAALKLYGPSGLFANDILAPGKHPVVLVDFWEYTCVNCLNTLPYVKEWAKRYTPDGLVIIGVHTPEFKFGRDPANVARSVKHLGITYPVLIDSNYDNWNDFNNESWPADYLLDAHGHVVSTHEGEGDYASTEQEIRHLLLQANPGETLPPAYGDPASDAGMSNDMTAELYAGSERGQIQNPEGFGNGQATDYKWIAPEDWQDGQIVALGTWSFDSEYAQHLGNSPADSIGVRYHAKDCVAVIKPNSPAPIDVKVTENGLPIPKSQAGADISYAPDGSSLLHVDAPREYQITQHTPPGEHNLEIYPGSDQFRLYSFCFSNVY